MEQTYLDDIFSQSGSLKRCAEEINTQVEIMKKIREEEYEKIIFAGMGSSNYGSMAADIFLTKHGVISIRYSASELLHHYKEILNEKTLLVILLNPGKVQRLLI